MAPYNTQDNRSKEGDESKYNSYIHLRQNYQNQNTMTPDTKSHKMLGVTSNSRSMDQQYMSANVSSTQIDKTNNTNNDYDDKKENQQQRVAHSSKPVNEVSGFEIKPKLMHKEEILKETLKA